MNNVTIIKSDNKPAFVVMPYDDYLALTKAPRVPDDDTIPHEVIELMTGNGWSLIRAWREHLGLSQTHIADALGIKQPSYAAMEATGARPKKSTKERIATALGVSYEQISL